MIPSLVTQACYIVSIPADITSAPDKSALSTHLQYSPGNCKFSLSNIPWPFCFQPPCGLGSSGGYFGHCAESTTCILMLWGLLFWQQCSEWWLFITSDPWVSLQHFFVNLPTAPLVQSINLGCLLGVLPLSYNPLLGQKREMLWRTRCLVELSTQRLQKLHVGDFIPTHQTSKLTLAVETYSNQSILWSHRSRAQSPQLPPWCPPQAPVLFTRASSLKPQSSHNLQFKFKQAAGASLQITEALTIFTDWLWRILQMIRWVVPTQGTGKGPELPAPSSQTLISSTISSSQPISLKTLLEVEQQRHTRLLEPECSLFALASLQLSFLPVYGGRTLPPSTWRTPVVSPGTYCLSPDNDNSENFFIATRQKSEEFLCYGLGDIWSWLSTWLHLESAKTHREEESP
jgi:hypothetical protein